MNAADIAGYLFGADVFHPSCLIEVMVSAGVLSPAALGMDPEAALDQHASVNGIDRDEDTFDSGDFPKVIHALPDELGAECGHCTAPLGESPLVWSCGRCGQDNTGTDTCTGCGHLLGE